MMNSTALAIFTKTIGLSKLKTRLSPTMTETEIHKLHLLNCQAIEETVHMLKSIDSFWALAESQAIGQDIWSGLPNLDQGTGSLGERLFHIFETLRPQYKNIIFIGADSPQINHSTIERSTELLKSYDFVLGPATDGGYYLFAGKENVSKDIWSSVPYSSCDTYFVFKNKLEAIGTVAILESMTDIDDQSSLSHVIKEFAQLPIIRPTQQRIIEHLKRYS